jgi:hypothetical protein
MRDRSIEGRLQDLLLDALRLRFGEPDARVVARVHRASSAEVDDWTERLVNANSIDEVFR